MRILIICTIIDYITAIISSAINHKISSSVGFKGILRKFMMFCIVGLTYYMSYYMLGSDDILTVTLTFYCANEIISILENAGKAGVPLPKQLVEMLAILKGDSNENS